MTLKTLRKNGMNISTNILAFKYSLDTSNYQQICCHCVEYTYKCSCCHGYVQRAASYLHEMVNLIEDNDYSEILHHIGHIEQEMRELRSRILDK